MKNFGKLISISIISVLNVLAISCNCYEGEYISRPWKIQEGHIGFTNYDSLWSVPATVSVNEQTHKIAVFAIKPITNDTCEYLGVSWHRNKPNGSVEFSFSERNTPDFEYFDILPHEINSRHCVKQPNTFEITEIDSVNRTISGRFSGTLCSLNNSHRVQISVYDGQFLKVPF